VSSSSGVSTYSSSFSVSYFYNLSGTRVYQNEKVRRVSEFQKLTYFVLSGCYTNWTEPVLLKFSYCLCGGNYSLYCEKYELLS